MPGLIWIVLNCWWPKLIGGCHWNFVWSSWEIVQPLKVLILKTVLWHGKKPALVNYCLKTISKSQSYSNTHLFLTYAMQVSWVSAHLVKICWTWLQAVSWVQVCFTSLIPQWLVGCPKHSLHMAKAEAHRADVMLKCVKSLCTLQLRTFRWPNKATWSRKLIV